MMYEAVGLCSRIITNNFFPNAAKRNAPPMIEVLLRYVNAVFVCWFVVRKVDFVMLRLVVAIFLPTVRVWHGKC